MRTEQPTPFDLWLHGVLTRACGTADTEAVPDDLLRLLPRDGENEPDWYRATHVPTALGGQHP